MIRSSFPTHLIRIAAVLLSFAAMPVRAETILFVGNSFTFGAGSAAWHYRPGSVEDLNGEGVGGVPAIFKRFTEQAGLDYTVALETGGGRSLGWHLNERRAVIDRAWDQVVLQEYSTLDAGKPGDATRTIADTKALATLFRARNPKVSIRLTATWSRPDLVYRPGSPWSGRPIGAMAVDLRRAYDRAAKAAGPAVKDVVPVGQAFTCAIRTGVADGDPYDGTAPGQVDLWTDDHYHASAAGYYLEALMLFASITGRDPRTLGAGEAAAADLGIAPALAVALQKVAQRATATDGACGR
ncbi:SGNH/GDSL hydrolase family protein [Sphingomonas mollis]|nr:SGNH/GDSL hydrolase family protein [Sphingomonas sp. BT553]